MKMIDSIDKLTWLYVNMVVRLHRVPVSIVLDQDPKFISCLWTSIRHALETIKSEYCFSSSVKCTIWKEDPMKDLLRACILEFGGTWKDHLPLVKFTYNNNYHTTVGMTSYKALYGKRCWTPVCWEEVGDTKEIGLELVQVTTEKIKTIKDRMKAAQDRQKSYIDNRRTPLEFNIGDIVF